MLFASADMHSFVDGQTEDNSSRCDDLRFERQRSGIWSHLLHCCRQRKCDGNLPFKTILYIFNFSFKFFIYLADFDLHLKTYLNRTDKFI